MKLQEESICYYDVCEKKPGEGVYNEGESWFNVIVTREINGYTLWIDRYPGGFCFVEFFHGPADRERALKKATEISKDPSCYLQH